MAEIRSPGLFEGYHIVRHALRMDSCVLSAARYAHPERLSLSEQILYPAIRSLISQHPALCIRLSKDTTPDQTHFIRLDSIDLSEIIFYVDESSQKLEEIIESQLAKFDTSQELPLWRLTVLNDNTIIFACHHGIGDGTSSVAFHRTLLRALAEQKQGSDSFVQKVFIPEDITLIGTSDQLTDVSPSWFEVISAILGLFVPLSWTSASKSWTGLDIPAQIPPLQTHARVIQLPAKDVQRLTELCRAHKATITSALYSMIISSLSSTLQSPTYLPLIARKSTISTSIPVSVRPYTGASKDAICDHISGVQLYSPIMPHFSWSDASVMASTLRSKSNTCKSRIGLLKFVVGNYEGFIKGKLGQKREVAMELSNIGRFELDDDQDKQSESGWEIQDLVFAQCDAVVGPAIKVNVASAPSGNMAICVNWSDSAVDGELVDMFITRFKSQISEILDGAAEYIRSGNTRQ